MKFAVAFICFDRFTLARHSFARVLRALPRRWLLKAFLDGWIDANSYELVGVPSRINACNAMFRSAGVALESQAPWNQGCAQMWFAAERWAFEEESADVLIIIEDDIFISPHYFSMMATLGRMAIENEDIGAFSAFGDSSRTYLRQFMTRNHFTPLHHRWGVGMTKAFWRKGREDYVAYLDLMRGCGYRQRPHEKIQQFLGALRNAQGIAHLTSQDAAHTAIMLHHGGYSFMPPTSYAINLGKRGLHFQPAFYHEKRNQLKGRYPFFPIPVPLSARSLRRQSRQLQSLSVTCAYW